MRRKKFPTSVRGLATGGLMRRMGEHWPHLISFLAIRRMQREDLCKSCNPLQNICQQLSSWMILTADNQEAYSGRRLESWQPKLQLPREIGGSFSQRQRWEGMICGCCCFQISLQFLCVDIWSVLDSVTHSHCRYTLGVTQNTFNGFVIGNGTTVTQLLGDDINGRNEARRGSIIYSD